MTGALAGCGRGHDWRQAVTVGPPPDSDAGYSPPPVVLSAQRVGDTVVVNGRAQVNSRLRLQSPEGEAFGGTAGADGGWSMPAPTAGGPHLYAVGEENQGRIDRAEGYVAALPSGRPAALLRPGDGAQALGGSTRVLQIGALDYDAGGWAIVSGLARPGAPLRLQVDNAPVAELKADSHGRFTLALKPAELQPGSHHLQVQSSNETAAADVAVTAAGPISGSYRGRREGAAWRIDWQTPGGGVQTSLILDP